MTSKDSKWWTRATDVLPGCAFSYDFYALRSDGPLRALVLLIVALSGGRDRHAAASIAFAAFRCGLTAWPEQIEV